MFLLWISFSKQLFLFHWKKHFVGLLIRFLPRVRSFQVKTIKWLYPSFELSFPQVSSFVWLPVFDIVLLWHHISFSLYICIKCSVSVKKKIQINILKPKKMSAFESWLFHLGLFVWNVWDSELNTLGTVPK